MDLGGRQIADFTLMQMFPWFGTKRLHRPRLPIWHKWLMKIQGDKGQSLSEVYTQWYILQP